VQRHHKYSLEQKAHVLNIQARHGGGVSPDGAVEHKPFLLLQVQNALLDGVGHYEARGVDGLVLADAMGAVNGLMYVWGVRE
jgi:hypothetical protein